MPIYENSSWETEYDDEYADNETAALEVQALQNVRESEDEGEDSDGSGTSSDSDGDSSSSDDESTESPEHPDTGAPNNTSESEEITVRGLTRLKKLKKKFKGKKHVIEFDKLGRFKGEYKSEIASYMGVLELSIKGVKVRESHKYNHRTGRAGYAGMLEKLIKEKEIREDENPSRSLLWRKAHQNKNGEYDDDDVREKAAHLEEFDKQLEDGTLTKKPGTDSITLVFGEEHGGRVRCAGKGVTPTTYWNLPWKGASKEHIELQKQLDDERRRSQMERERKDEEMKEMKEAMNAQAKMMSNLVSQLKSQGVLKKKKTKSKKARKSPIRETSLMHESPVRSNSSTERRESNTNRKYSESQHVSQSTTLKDSSELQMPGKHKQKSLASEHLSLNSPEESQLKDKTEVSTIGGKCKLAHASLRNIIALGSVLPSVPGQLVHGDELKDDCVRVTVEESIFKNHCLPVPSTHLRTVEDVEKSVVAWPKEFVICCSTGQPFSDPDEHDVDPDEHDANPNTKKRKKKKPSNTKSGELKSRRSNKRLKIAA
ncbi:uncharacterized protein LOC113305447 [Papaver somniferum]|uniref:uncharacterized protein LOC113305447 n=1 Tax=Papaver somniferum TaxID=3469 RepID=UPI000E6FC277|nr:uncharacterized protein LOC113305447 [Papaver somniferum]